ncbi:synaptoporin-like protein [Saccoglossus kowalevskii]|uniref:Synaptoporin-like protein n=1 Tax=Saccoglossus kowalevskii TaxID=10224 RepID=D1LXF4_SACKO|nr:synaptoporin-like protein [Saccoglossus kowalevskii]ACY92660.1 synaptoporin-like protein [Saccoglossus kowalevskii]
MEAAQQMITKNYSLRVLKEPRGFIKFLEFILAIFAFATTAGHCGYFTFKLSCNDDDYPAERVDYCYPFDMTQTTISYPLCVHTTPSSTMAPNEINLKLDPSSSAEYFVAVGVLAFLYCIVALVWYVFFEKNHRDKDLLPLGDFVMTCIFVLLWLTGSSAWAKGVTDVKYATDFDTVQSLLPECSLESVTCTLVKSPSYATLNVSIVFGFLNMFVWAGNVWFVYKETPWFDKYEASKQRPANPMTPEKQDIETPDNTI